MTCLYKVFLWSGVVALLASCQAVPQVNDIPATIGRAVNAQDAITFHEVGAIDVSIGADELTLAAATRHALRNDPALQSALSRVKTALADAEQTRLLPNPILSVVLRFPESGGGPVFEAGLTAELLSLIQRPKQISAADNRLRAAASDALTAALDVVSETQAAYVMVRLAEDQLAVLIEREAILDRLLQIAHARVKAGEAARLDVLTLEGQRAELAVERTENESRRKIARLALARTLGEPSSVSGWILKPWSPPFPQELSEERLVAAALQHRPEIQSRRWELAALGDDAAITRWDFLSGGGGLAAERDGNWSVGPAVDLPLPVFDWGQARQARAAARIMESRHELTLLQRKVITEVRQAVTSIDTARKSLHRVETELVPIQERRLAQAESQYRNGVTDVTTMLLAQQDLQGARARRVAYQQEFSAAWAKLERAVGGAAALMDALSASPTTQPAPRVPKTNQ